MSHVSYSTYLVQLNKVSNFMPLPSLLHLSREYQRHEHYSPPLKNCKKQKKKGFQILAPPGPPPPYEFLDARLLRRATLSNSQSTNTPQKFYIDKLKDLG